MMCLGGLFKPHEYGDVILPFVILRRLDCVIEPRKDEIYNLYDEYKSKMEDKGSRIGIVFNGSPLFTGDAGSGESEILRERQSKA